ncbi:MAG: tetratricopeptide repeat protein, partial [Acidobacteriota bacterium]
LRPRIDELRRELTEVRALLLAGREADAGAPLAAIVGEARTLGYGPLLAEALYLLGRERANEPPAAIAAFDEAEYTATVSRVDYLAARAAARRLGAGALTTADEPLRRSWADRARAWVQRDGDLEAEFDLETGLALIASQAGEHAEAERHFRRALDVGTRVFGDANARVSSVQGSFGLVLVQMGRFDDAIAILGKSIATDERAYGGETRTFAATLDNYGLALAMVGRFRDARAALERALAIKSTVAWVRGAVMCDLARVAVGEGDSARAIELGKQGLATIEANQPNGFYVAINEDPLAAAYAAANRPADALATARDCLAHFAKANNTGLDTVACLTLEGAALADTGHPADAVPELERALQLQTGHVAAPGVLADIQFQLARALAASGKDRERARELAARAREELARYPFKQAELAQLDAWAAR